MAPTQLFSCEYCKIFKNSYFEEHPRRAASEVRIKPKLNLRKQVFFKTDAIKYSLKATEWHLYWSVFLMKKRPTACNISKKRTLSGIFFFFKNFVYFSGITILRNISEWQGSNAVLNYKEQMKDEKKESYWSQNCQGIERVSMVKKLPAKKCLYN